MAVFLARMVMPRSFSSALESMTRSVSGLRASSVPDWRRSWSTSVVLPWSTWAMIAMLRRFEGAEADTGEPATGLGRKLWASVTAAIHGRCRPGIARAADAMPKKDLPDVVQVRRQRAAHGREMPGQRPEASGGPAWVAPALG